MKKTRSSGVKKPRLPPIPGKNGLVSSSRFQNSKLMTYRRSNEYQDVLSNIIVNEACKAAEETADEVRRQPPKQYPPEMPTSMMSSARKTRQMYMYMKKCAEGGPVVPLQQEWLNSMLTKVPEHLQESAGQREHIEELFVEVKKDFTSSMKKSMVQHVLLKPSVKGLENVVSGPPPAEPLGLDYSSPWHDTFVKAKMEIVSNLWITHPSMQTVLDMCQDSLQSMILVVLSDLRNQGPTEIESLKNHVLLAAEKSEGDLMHGWFPKVLNIFTDNKRFSNIKSYKMDSFYTCVSTLISNQLKDLVERSLEHWVSLFKDENKSQLPIFKMQLTFDENPSKTDGKMEFFPSYQDLEDCIIFVAKTIMGSMHSVPTVQSWLSGSSTTIPIDTDIADHISDKALAFLKEAVKNNFVEPQEYMQGFVKDYSFLVNGEAAADIEKFMAEEHSFEDYCALIEKFRTFTREINDLDNVVHFDMIPQDGRNGAESSKRTL